MPAMVATASDANLILCHLDIRTAPITRSQAIRLGTVTFIGSHVNRVHNSCDGLNAGATTTALIL